MRKKKFAILTSGGDAPGMNAAVANLTMWIGQDPGWEVVWIKQAFYGLCHNLITPSLSSTLCHLLLNQGGTFLESKRYPQFAHEQFQRQGVATLADHQVDVLCVIGGNGSYQGGRALINHGFKNVIFMPASIDNDVPYTDQSLGSMTAFTVACQALEQIKATARSHHRCIIVEVMGRDCGYLTMSAGVAAGVDLIFTPEMKCSVADVLTVIKTKAINKNTLVVAVTENLFELSALAAQVQQVIKLEVRTSVLGYPQRGAAPTAEERLLAYKMSRIVCDQLLGCHQQSFVVGVNKHGRPITIDIPNNQAWSDHQWFLQQGLSARLARDCCKHNQLPLASKK